MRDYATVAPQFWLGKTGRELRKQGAEAQVVSFYLMTSPHANMLGLYYLPVLYIAHETGLGFEGALKGLKRSIEAGFCSYDEVTEMVWVHEMAAYQVGKELKPGDNRCAGVRNEYASLTDNPFLSAFYERYKTDFHLSHKRESHLFSEGASKGLRSQDQDQDQEQDKDSSGQGSATPTDDQEQDDGDKPESQKKYPDEFERVWTIYPKRSGGNSKTDAFKAWNARIRDGTTAREIHEGVERYAAFVKAEGSLNTQFVKQAKTFFGPGMHFSEPWTIQQVSGPRDPNQISEPDKKIPSGFRG
ncbi:TPA: DNA-binding protein [Citrobacter amalonaticus]|nr:DNA-binding protein [Citrobacter amalonaticus]HEM7848362.1 DNA-binding protein [Citrobacter amalonaticus]HEM7922916.1 DNA-binding protein [Citrobacter amalonaticus]